MNKKIHILFLFLSLFALTLIGYDYVCGHFGEDPFIVNNCLLCKAFQSTILGCNFLILFLCFGILPVIGFYSLPDWFSSVPLYMSVISLRAPPFINNSCSV